MKFEKKAFTKKSENTFKVNRTQMGWEFEK